MATAAEFRDEARHMRVLALEIVTDAVVQAELQALIDELEARALEADGARSGDAAPANPPPGRASNCVPLIPSFVEAPPRRRT